METKHVPAVIRLRDKLVQDAINSLEKAFYLYAKAEVQNPTRGSASKQYSPGDTPDDILQNRITTIRFMLKMWREHYWVTDEDRKNPYHIAYHDYMEFMAKNYSDLSRVKLDRVIGSDE